MPFTPAHFVALLPVRKIYRQVSVSAFLCGSVIPDFAGFLWLRTAGDFTHSYRGILLFDIPAGMVLLYLFHAWVREPLIRNLPGYYQQRFIGSLSFNWRLYLLKNSQRVLVSLFLGIVSHLAWDAFTHENGVVVEWLPVLSRKAGLAGYTWPVYFWLQLISSVAGLCLIHLQLKTLKPTAVGISKREPYFWPGLILVMLVILLFRYMYGGVHNTPLSLLKAFIGSFIYGLLLTSLFSKIIFKKWNTTYHNNSLFYRDAYMLKN